MKIIGLIFFVSFSLYATNDGILINQTKGFPAFIKDGQNFKSCFSNGDFANELSAGEVVEEDGDFGLNSYCCITGMAYSQDTFTELRPRQFKLLVEPSAWIEEDRGSGLSYFFSTKSRHLRAFKKDFHFISNSKDSVIKSVETITCSPGLFNRDSFGIKEVKNQFGEYFHIDAASGRETASSKD